MWLTNGCYKYQLWMCRDVFSVEINVMYLNTSVVDSFVCNDIKTHPPWVFLTPLFFLSGIGLATRSDETEHFAAI